LRPDLRRLRNHYNQKAVAIVRFYAIRFYGDFGKFYLSFKFTVVDLQLIDAGAV